MSVPNPPAGLNASGQAHWEKHGSNFLCSTHFVTFDLWVDYCDELITARWKEKLLEGVQVPNFVPDKLILNLCKILDFMQDQIDSKSDKESFW